MEIYIFIGVFLLLITCIAPVSYTHLSQFSELGTSYKKICYSHICMPVMPVAQRLVKMCIRDRHKDEPFFMYFATNDVHVPRFPHDRFRGKNPMGVRGDAIVQFDWSVGQIMETLDKLGLAENTLIILSSDNGPVVDDGYDDKAEELLNGHSPDRKSTRLNSSHIQKSRMPSSA